MRRARVGHPGVRRHPLGLVHRQPVRVHRHRHQPAAGREERRTSSGVARVFHPDRVTGIEEHSRREVHPLLRSTGDDDLPGDASRTPGDPHVLGDRVAERRVAGGVAVLQRRVVPPPSSGEPGPERNGEVVQGGHAGPEWYGRRLPPRESRHRCRGDGPAPDRWPRPPPARPLQGRWIHGNRGDSSPGARGPLDVSLGRKLIERENHGIPRHP